MINNTVNFVDHKSKTKMDESCFSFTSKDGAHLVFEPEIILPLKCCLITLQHLSQTFPLNATNLRKLNLEFT